MLGKTTKKILDDVFNVMGGNNHIDRTIEKKHNFTKATIQLVHLFHTTKSKYRSVPSVGWTYEIWVLLQTCRQQTTQGGGLAAIDKPPPSSRPYQTVLSYTLGICNYQHIITLRRRRLGTVDIEHKYTALK